jgi:predicted lipoprotein
VLGAATSTLRRHVAALEQSTATRLAAESGTDKQRCFREFHDGTGSWSRLERIIALVGAGPQGTDTRFVVTSLAGGTGRRIYEELYYAREQAENHVKA